MRFEAFLKEADRDMSALDPHAVRYFEQSAATASARPCKKALTEHKRHAIAYLRHRAHTQSRSPPTARAGSAAPSWRCSQSPRFG